MEAIGLLKFQIRSPGFIPIRDWGLRKPPDLRDLKNVPLAQSLPDLEQNSLFL